jgi:hypothetical protein
MWVLGPTAEELSFARPKESSQRKGRPQPRKLFRSSLAKRGRRKGLLPLHRRAASLRRPFGLIRLASCGAQRGCRGLKEQRCLESSTLLVILLFALPVPFSRTEHRSFWREQPGGGRQGRCGHARCLRGRSPFRQPPSKARSAGSSDCRAAFSLVRFFWRSKRGTRPRVRQTGRKAGLRAGGVPQGFGTGVPNENPHSNQPSRSDSFLTDRRVGRSRAFQHHRPHHALPIPKQE